MLDQLRDGQRARIDRDFGDRTDESTANAAQAGGPYAERAESCVRCVGKDEGLVGETTVPSAVPLLENVTVPVAPVGSVSVNVTELPCVDGFRDDVSVGVTPFFPTVCVTVPLAALKLLSPG